jgi:hypothetical protein
MLSVCFGLTPGYIVMLHLDERRSRSGFILAFYPDIQPELTPSFVRSRLLAAASCQELMCCLVILSDHHSSVSNTLSPGLRKVSLPALLSRLWLGNATSSHYWKGAHGGTCKISCCPGCG